MYTTPFDVSAIQTYLVSSFFLCEPLSPLWSILPPAARRSVHECRTCSAETAVPCRWQRRASSLPRSDSSRKSLAPSSRKGHSSSASAADAMMTTAAASAWRLTVSVSRNASPAPDSRSMTRTLPGIATSNSNASAVARQPRTRTWGSPTFRLSSASQRGRFSRMMIPGAMQDTLVLEVRERRGREILSGRASEHESPTSRSRPEKDSRPPGLDHHLCSMPNQVCALCKAKKTFVLQRFAEGRGGLKFPGREWRVGLTQRSLILPL